MWVIPNLNPSPVFSSNQILASLAAPPLSLASLVGQSKSISQRQIEISSALQVSSVSHSREALHRRLIKPNRSVKIHALIGRIILHGFPEKYPLHFISIRPPALIYHSRVAIAVSLCKKPINVGKCRNMCAASNSDTIVKSSDITSKKEEEHGDLKSWMEKNGLPPCKVVLKERPSHDSKHRPIYYVAAREDLQEGDVAFSVPNSLVVTRERVLGNENMAELLTTNKIAELACLALYLMYEEKKQGKKSFWYPYIRELDHQRGRGQLAVESPLLWSEAELDYLTGSPTKAEVLERAEGIKREYNELDTVWFMAGSLFQIKFWMMKFV